MCPAERWEVCCRWRRAVCKMCAAGRLTRLAEKPGAGVCVAPPQPCTGRAYRRCVARLGEVPASLRVCFRLGVFFFKAAPVGWVPRTRKLGVRGSTQRQAVAPLCTALTYMQASRRLVGSRWKVMAGGKLVACGAARRRGVIVCFCALRRCAPSMPEALASRAPRLGPSCLLG